MVSKRRAGAKTSVKREGSKVASERKVAKKPATPTKRGALVRVDPDGTVLSRADERLLAEAVRRGREVVSTTESAVAEYGQWLFANVFAADTKLVLDQRPDHPLWVKLVKGKGSADPELPRSMMVTTLRVAALDKRLSDQAWSRLAYSYKVALLPLNEPNALRDAARHVLAASLNVAETREYVGNLRNEEGRAVRLTPKMASGAIDKMVAPFKRPRYLQRLETQLGHLEGDARDKTRGVIDELLEYFARLRKKLDE